MILLGIFCNEIYLVRLIRPFKHPLFVVLVFFHAGVFPLQYDS